jgi:hypothetical protein
MCSCVPKRRRDGRAACCAQPTLVDGLRRLSFVATKPLQAQPAGCCAARGGRRETVGGTTRPHPPASPTQPAITTGEPPILRWFPRWFPRWFLRNRGGSQRPRGGSHDRLGGTPEVVRGGSRSPSDHNGRRFGSWPPPAARGRLPSGLTCKVSALNGAQIAKRRWKARRWARIAPAPPARPPSVPRSKYQRVLPSPPANQ